MKDPIIEVAKIIDKYNKEIELEGSYIHKIKNLLNDLYKNNFYENSLGKLTERMTQIAMYLMHLSDEVNRSTLDYNGAYTYRKWAEAGAFNRRVRAGAKITQAQVEVKMDILKEIQIELEAQYRTNLYKGFYDDIDRLLSILQTRCRILEKELFHSNKQV